MSPFNNHCANKEIFKKLTCTNDHHIDEKYQRFHPDHIAVTELGYKMSQTRQW